MIEIEELEREPDTLDQASKLERIAVSEGLQRVQRSKESPPSDFDGRHCTECGNEIPEGRLATGAFRDITCQERMEKARKNHRSHYE